MQTGSLEAEAGRLDAALSAAVSVSAALSEDIAAQATVSLSNDSGNGSSGDGAASGTTLALSADLVAAQELDNAQAAADVRALQTAAKELQMELSDVRLLLEHARVFHGGVQSARADAEMDSDAEDNAGDRMRAAREKDYGDFAVVRRKGRGRKSVVHAFAQLQRAHGGAGVARDLLPTAAASASAAAGDSSEDDGDNAQECGPRGKRARGADAAADAAVPASATVEELAALRAEAAELEAEANQAAAELYLLEPALAAADSAASAKTGSAVATPARGARPSALDASTASPLPLDSSLLAGIAPLLRTARKAPATVGRAERRVLAQARLGREAAERALEDVLQQRLAAGAEADAAVARAAALGRAAASTVAVAVGAGAGTRMRGMTERVLRWLLALPGDVDDGSVAEGAQSAAEASNAARAAAKAALAARLAPVASLRAACGVVVDVTAGLSAAGRPFALINQPVQQAAAAASAGAESTDEAAFTAALDVLARAGVVRWDRDADTVALALPLQTAT